MLSWRHMTREQYGSGLQAVAAFAVQTRGDSVAIALADPLSSRAQEGATAASLQSITAARAIEDLQWMCPLVTALHKRSAVGAAAIGMQPYLPPKGLTLLVERARPLRYGPMPGALAVIGWICWQRRYESPTSPCQVSYGCGTKLARKDGLLARLPVMEMRSELGCTVGAASGGWTTWCG